MPAEGTVIYGCSPIARILFEWVAVRFAVIYPAFVRGVDVRWP